MGFFNKLLFWKRDDELPDLPVPSDVPPPSSPRLADLAPPSMGEPMGEPEPQFNPQGGFSPREQFEPPARPAYKVDSPRAFEEMRASPDDRMALISEKLDTIKAQLDNVLQRLDRIDRSRDYQQRWR